MKKKTIPFFDLALQHKSLDSVLKIDINKVIAGSFTKSIQDAL